MRLALLINCRETGGGVDQPHIIIHLEADKAAVGLRSGGDGAVLPVPVPALCPGIDAHSFGDLAAFIGNDIRGTEMVGK